MWIFFATNCLITLKLQSWACWKKPMCFNMYCGKRQKIMHYTYSDMFVSYFHKTYFGFRMQKIYYPTSRTHRRHDKVPRMIKTLCAHKLTKMSSKKILCQSNLWKCQSILLDIGFSICCIYINCQNDHVTKLQLIW